MALNIKNAEVERLAREVADITGESKTEAVRKALQERRARLGQGVRRSRPERWLAFLEEEAWATLPASERGRRLTKDEEEQILGFAPEAT